MRKTCFAFALLALSGSAVSGTPMQLEERWVYLPPFFGPGHKGITVGDYDGDGALEALVTGHFVDAFISEGSGVAATLAGDGHGGVRVDSFKLYDRPFISPIVKAPSEHGADRVATVFQTATGYEIAVLGGKPVDIVRTIPIDTPLRISLIADVDGDGELEALGLDDVMHSGLPTLVDFATGATEWASMTSSWGINALQLDADPPLEIVLESSPGLVLDGATRAQDWSYAGGFSQFMITGNFDADAASTEFATGSSSSLQIFRGSPYSPISEVDVVGISSIIAQDIDSDGTTEIIVGEGSWGNVAVFDPITGDEVEEFATPDGNVSALAIGDIDGDGADELVFGAGLRSGGPDVLQVHDMDSRLVELHREVDQDHAMVVHRADVDADGAIEVLRATNSGIPEVFDWETGQPRPWPIPGEGFGRIGAGIRILSAQLDDDPALEVLTIRGTTIEDEVTVHDGATWEVQYSTRLNSFGWGDGLADVLFADVQGSSEPELILLTEVDTRIIVFEPLTGDVLWSSVSMTPNAGSHARRVLVRDVDADPALEFVALVDSTVWVFDYETQLLEWTHDASSEDSIPSDLLILGDGPNCTFAVIYPEGRLERSSCATRTSAGSMVLPPNSYLTTSVHDSGEHVVLVSEGYVYEVSESGGIKRLSEFYVEGDASNGAGQMQSLGDGRLSLLLGTSAVITRLEIDLHRLFGNGFD